MVNPLRLEQMPFFDAGATGLVDIAAEFGVPKVSFWTLAGGSMQGAHVVTDETKKSVRERLDHTGVVAESIEFFALTSPPDLDRWRRAFDVGAYLGATTAVAVNVNLADEAQAAESLGQLAQVADNFGIVVALEPICMGMTRTLEEGERLVRLSGSETARLNVDIIHMVRTGSTPAAVRALDPSLIRVAQLCDGPARAPSEGLRYESAYQRMIPGEGDFPVVEFLAALPDNVSVGMEVPLRNLREQGVSPRDRAKRIIDGTRRAQELASKP
jgi:sugar phosphate isomerase/epimerase